MLHPSKPTRQTVTYPPPFPPKIPSLRRRSDRTPLPFRQHTSYSSCPLRDFSILLVLCIPHFFCPSLPALPHLLLRSMMPSFEHTLPLTFFLSLYFSPPHFYSVLCLHPNAKPFRCFPTPSPSLRQLPPHQKSGMPPSHPAFFTCSRFNSTAAASPKSPMPPPR